jgi:uncharacterized protein (TIGR02147 family)
MTETQSSTYNLTPAEILKQALQEKQRKNPAYTMRAAARDAGVTSGFMSMVLSGKKRLTFKRAVQFAQLLKIDGASSDLLLRAVALESTTDSACRAYLANALGGDSARQQQEYAVLELDRFRTLSDWYHIAILDLTLVKGFESNAAWVSEELGISLEQATSAVARLQRLGLLEITKDGQWIKTDAKLAIPTTYSDKAMRDFQEQMIDKAREALQSPSPEDFAARDISGVSMAIDPARLPEAKLRIQRFRRDMLEFLEEGESTELYRMNVQLFRLSKKRRKQ